MSMYFQDRATAGSQLAAELTAYKGQPAIVIALSDGGVAVGQVIADSLGCPLTILLLEPVKLPGESDALLQVREDGKYSYDEMWSTGQLEEFQAEYRTYIEQAKQQQYSELRHALGVSCLASSDLLHDRVIIVVSDGLKNGSSLEAAADFLKPVPRTKLIVASPLANPAAIDKMRLLADESHCLATVADYFDTDHYYEVNTLPSHQTIVKDIETRLFPPQPASTAV